jgi:hypothetical protein
VKENEQAAMKTLGSKRWFIPEGYIPAWSHGPEPQLTSHETVVF